MRSLSVIGMVLVVGAVVIGQQVGPEPLDRSFQRPGARALGMGGAYLLATDDATAVAWNPAALSNAKRFSVPVEIAGRSNFDVRDVNDLVDDLEEIRDQIPTTINTISDAITLANLLRSAFNSIKEFNRQNPTLSGSLAPIGGLSFGNYGLTVSSGAFGQVQTFVGQSDPIGLGISYTPPDTLHAVGGFVALTSIGIAYARPMPAGLVYGVTFRRVRADYIGFRAGLSLTDANGDGIPDDFDADGALPIAPGLDIVAGTAFNRVDSSGFTLDIGGVWEPPVQPPGVKMRYAGVVRNILPIKFSLPVSVRTGSTSGLPVPPNFDFRLNPEVDLGMLASWHEGKTTWVLELHNVTSSNGGDMSVHTGLEHWLSNLLALRVGYDDNQAVFGLGFNLGPFRIDAAAGSKIRKRLAVGIGFRF